MSKIKIKGYLTLLPFLAKALPAMDGAKKIPGVVHTDSKILNALENISLTIWESEQQMLEYWSTVEYQSLSLKTMQSTSQVKVCKWETDEIPNWEEVIQRLEAF